MIKPSSTIFSHLLFYSSYAYLSTNFLISHLISSRVTTHLKKHAHLCYTRLLSMISLSNLTFKKQRSSQTGTFVTNNAGWSQCYTYKTFISTYPTGMTMHSYNKPWQYECHEFESPYLQKREHNTEIMWIKTHRNETCMLYYNALPLPKETIETEATLGS